MLPEQAPAGFRTRAASPGHPPGAPPWQGNAAGGPQMPQARVLACDLHTCQQDVELLCCWNVSCGPA